MGSEVGFAGTVIWAIPFPEEKGLQHISPVGSLGASGWGVAIFFETVVKMLKRLPSAVGF